MRKMKDSGIEWIGQIPEGWETKKMGYMFEEIGSGTTPTSSDGSFYEGQYNWLQTGDLTDDYISETSKKITQEAITKYSTLKEYKKNTIIIAMYGATIGKLGILNNNSYTNQACCALSKPNKDIDSKYVYYWLLCNRENIVNLSYGGGQPNISQNTVNSLKISIPLYKEIQAKIADFLDMKCAYINKVIKEKTEINKKLADYRKSIIFEAVTKGLDKSAKLKDSGIEWIGQIPESWTTVKIKYTANLILNKSSNEFGNYIGLENVESNTGEFIKSSINEIESDGIKFDENDVLFGKLRPYLAKVYISNNKGICSSEFLVLRTTRCYPKLLQYLMLNESFISLVNSSTYGVKMPRASWDFVGNICLPISKCLVEQIKIAKYLDNKCAEIDNTIKKNDSIIKKLAEYKNSLIYECVTGKREVV